MPDLYALPWTQIATLLLGNGLVIAVVNYLLNNWREARKERLSKEAAARYAALRVSAILERFAYSCADLISANNDVDPYQETGPGPRTVLPQISDFPSDIDWKALDPLLASRALSLATEGMVSERSIEFQIEVVGDIDSMANEASEQAGKCGYRAWILADEMRRRYGLPNSHLLEVTWPWLDELRTKHEAAMARLAERQEETVAARF